MSTENVVRHLREEDIYKVVTIVKGQTKTQRWDISKPLILPEPMNCVMKVKGGKVYFGDRPEGVLVLDSALEVLGDVKLLDDFKLDHAQCKISIEKIVWSDAIHEKEEETNVSQCLYYLAIRGCDSARDSVEKFQTTYDVIAAERKIATVKSVGSGIQVVCMADGMKALLGAKESEDLQAGRTYTFENSQLNEFQLTYYHDWWKFKPISRTFEILKDLPANYKDDTRALSIVGLILALFLLISLGNYIYHTWTGLTDNKPPEPKKEEVVVAEVSKDVKLPEKFVAERKTREEELHARDEVKVPKDTLIVNPGKKDEKPDPKVKQAILGDGKLPPGGQKNGPMAPAAAKGNGVAAAVNGGHLGTMKGKLSDAAPLPKTLKVHAGKGLPKDAFFTKQKIAPMAYTDKAVSSTSVIALQQDQAKKLLQRKAQALKSAFGSVLGYLNDKQAPDDLAQTDPKATRDGRLPKKGGLLVAAGGTGSGKTNDDQVRVLGQMGSAAGRGIVGGTGGAPNGAAGGYGLSTRYKGTGTSEGSGIGGSTRGNLFVDFDALNSTGDFAGSISEGLTKSEVGKVIHEHSSEIRQCYESSLLKTPGIKGRMIVDFTITSGGSVSRAVVKEAAFNSSFLGGCMINRLKTWMFPRPRNGVSVQVTYPFNFRTLGGN